MPSVVSRLNCFSKKSNKHKLDTADDDTQNLISGGSNVTAQTKNMGSSETSNGVRQLHLEERRPNRYNDDNSIPTIDPDYKQVQSGNCSLSDAGGTIGTHNQSLSNFSQAASAFGTLAPSVSNNHHGGGESSITGMYNDYLGGGYLTSSSTPHQEEMLEIYAPSGRLGLVIDTPSSEDTPVVHAIKDTCPIRDQIYVGDKLVAVDDEDVRNFTAMEVSRLIGNKSGQDRRKLTIIRASGGRDGMY